MKKIIVLTSGGDAPGMNAAIRAVVRTGYYYGLKVFGSPLGFQGLVDKKLIELYPESVANCIQQGGTFLKADRCQAFKQKETRAQCRAFLKQEGIDGLIVIGGNGSFKGAALLAQEDGLAVIGIPGTIDNDVPDSEYSIGFDTARNTALQAIDRIRDTASSHDRPFLVEVMGRHSGALAVDVGIAGGAEIILIPEVDTSIETLAQKITAKRRIKLGSIIVVAEAAQPGRTLHIAEQLEKITQLSYGVCILGHTQRGGTPSLLDRKIASEMGYLAVKGLIEGESNKMVAMQNAKLTLQPFPSVTALPRVFTQMDLLKINEILCT
jgi:6-phosphofructokinase 1